MLETFEDLLGQTLTNVEKKGSRGKEENEEIVFALESGEKYRLTHFQDCCEDVYIEDINGNLADLIGFPLTLAEEAHNQEEDCGSETWTFYRLATIQGYVTIRWYGSSNGYYSESVDWERMEDTGAI